MIVFYILQCLYVLYLYDPSVIYIHIYSSFVVGLSSYHAFQALVVGQAMVVGQALDRDSLHAYNVHTII